MDKEFKNEDNPSLLEFVERIAHLFDQKDVSTAQIVLTTKNQGNETHCHLSGYQLRRAPLKILAKEDLSDRKHVYMRIIPKEQYREIFNKNFFSQVIDTHQLTLKQDLHFDAFRKLLYEKGLVVKQVIDWKIQRSSTGMTKIKEYGKKISAVEKNPSIVKHVCIISRKTIS